MSRTDAVGRRCARQRRRMLLATTNELSLFGRRGLRRHLSGCAECRAVQRQMADVGRWWALAPAWSLPPPGSMERILAADGHAAPARGRRVLAFPVSAPLWRLAAAAALLLGWLGWEALRGTQRQAVSAPLPFPAAAMLSAAEALEDDLEQTLATWEALLALLPGDELNNGGHAEDEWQHLAYELLDWEDS